MKKIAVAMAAGCFCIGLTGCYQYVAVHPEKSKPEFYEDQALCEEKARAFAMERLEDVSHGDEINHSRRCMRGLGWNYHFRK